MTLSERPRAVRVLGWLLIATGAVAAVQLLAGVLELRYVRANAAHAISLASITSDAERAVSNLDAAAQIAIWVGALGAIASLAAWLLVRRVDPWARVAAWITAGSVFFGQFALMGQDSSIGISPFVDSTQNQVIEDLVNSLIVAPGYFLLIYPAEVAGLVLGVWIAVLLRGEDTVEYLRSRTEAAADPDWDAVLAARRAGSGRNGTR
ncbi:hypothetical protein F4553_007843 [Allocatelliglobosispora scoriae]|uniref:DUF2567 domain-containing protein n=1 Tax=Allocatelliglobosispora scoriae TaxID=643052 RepID=A0A841C544_9ACTN|nr:hypothetical protein [Allocatelliglobosispora scoriae]MBB5874409.1 hypothetical protein [Allocatelliglobosispora scoriae]